MAEALTAYVPQFWAMETLATLENNLVLASLVHRDFSNVIASEGDTVKTRKPGTFTANTKAIGAAVTKQTASADSVDVKLDQHVEVTFTVDDVSLATGMKNLIETQIVPAAQAIAQKVDSDVYAKMQKSFYYKTGTAGTVPSTLAALTGVRKVQNKKKWPFAGRKLAIGPEAEDKFLQLDAFINQNYVGGNGVPRQENPALQEAILGRKMGMDIYMDQNVELAFASPASDAVIKTDGAQTAGSNTLTWAADDAGTTLTTAPAVGDLLTISGDDYIVTGSVTNDSASVSPKLRAAYADNTVITVTGRNSSYSRLPFFQRNAIALVTRPLPNPADVLGGGVKSAVVSHGGVSIRAIMTYDADVLGWQITLDILYGVASLDPELGGFLLS